MHRVDTTVQVTVFAGTWVGSGASLGRVGSVPLCSCRGPCSRGPWFGNFLVSLSLGKWCFLPFSELSLSAPITLGLVSGIRCPAALTFLLWLLHPDSRASSAEVLLDYGSHGNLIPVKFVKKACVSIWPHLFMVPFLLLVAHADRVQPWPCPVGQREYNLWAVLDPSSSQFPSPIWLTRQGAPGGQSLTALVGVFASAKVQAFHACNSTDPLHWRTWGHNPVFVCYTSRLCLHLFKGDWLWSSWDVRRCS